MRYALPLLVVGLLIAVCPASAQELSEADARLLEDVLKSTLYDPPSGARRCRFKMRVRTVWGQETLVEREGWAIVGKDGKTKIMLADGWKVQGAQDVKPFDFRKGNSALLLALENPNRQPPPEASREHPLALAAWVYRTGDKGLASIFMGMALQEFQALKSRAPKGQAAEFKLPSVLRGHLTWQAYSALVHAYMIRADAEAERWGKHLQRRYAAEIKGTQVDQIMGDLARRKAAGTAGKTPTRKSMALLAAMAPAARIPALIAVLDEVDARQRTQPGGVDLASDPRVAALIDCKDLAVPALLDVLAKDQRLTRSVHFWRDFSQDRTVLSVAEVALVALQSILRVRVFKPSSTGDNFTVRGPKAARLAAEKLRGYWRANRAMSLSERLRRALTREQSAPEDWRRAATEIARLGQERRIGTTLGADQVSDTRGENPALELKDPTAAVAILAAMDRDLTQHKSSAKYRDLAGGELRELEALYMDALVRLGDKRIAPVLAKRAATETIPSMRRLLAVTCRGLGEGGPLNDLAVAFARGKHTVGAFSAPETPLELTPGAIELDACVQTFTQLAAGGVASCDSALFALASPKHPLRNLALELIWSKAGPEGGLWVQHSWHLRLLASALTQTQETGRIYRLE
ncbi:MAG: hypothetical protein JKY65_34245, partial [Planctomycetes bacterium]|nr:hypothetical protein [Planctomycetota bacterium]